MDSTDAGERESAFGLSEQCRARSLVELLSQRGHADSHDSQTLQLMNRKLSLQQQLAAVHSLKPENPARSARLLQIERKLDHVESQIHQASPRLGNAANPSKITSEVVSREVLREGELLLEYYVSAERVYVWMLSCEDSQCVALEASKREVDKNVERCLRPFPKAANGNLQSQSDYGVYGEESINASRWLFDKLIKPAEIRISSARSIIICPHGALHYVPFEALTCGFTGSRHNDALDGCVFWAEQLAERNQVLSYTPSALVLAEQRKEFHGEANSNETPPRNASNRLLAFGNPKFPAGQELRPIPASQREVQKIYKRFAGETPAPTSVGEGEPSAGILDYSPGCLALLGKEANLSRARSEPLQGYDYVHFATHGLVNEVDPMMSGIALAVGDSAEENDCWLRMYEVFSMRMTANLVTLSACETGLGRLDDGEGMVSMTYGFFVAGADALLVSLWKVSDEATADFMIAFYESLLRDNSKGKALIEAKIQMIKKMIEKNSDLDYRNPFYWAPFVLYGDAS